MLVTAVEEMLDLEDVDPEDDFFELGGVSVVLVRLSLQIEEEFGVDFPLTDMFEYRSLGQLASEIEQRMPAH